MGIVGNAAFQMIVLLLFVGSGSFWPAAVWHATLNAFGGAFFFTMVSGADKVRLGVMLAIAYALVAVVMLMIGVGRDRWSPTRDNEPVPGLAHA
jgi:hypothetical protein